MTQTAPIGLITAIPEELARFGEHFREHDRREVAGLVFRTGAIDGRAVVAVEAGIGKVNAALVATLLAREFGCRALTFSGVAGGLDPDLGVGDVVVATRLVCHDYGALVDGRIVVYQPGVPPLPGVDTAHGYDMPAPLEARLRGALDGLALPSLGARAAGGMPRRPVLRFGTILTGDSFLNCAATRHRLHDDFGGLAVEMEGAAVAQVAGRFGIPWVVVRALSDLAGADSHVDFPAFLSETAGLAAAVMRRVVAAV
ncbi:MAG: 5'-methylthioadenosine/adenosylhomocysteine nucleosidase [Inquilinaceae bacterium]